MEYRAPGPVDTGSWPLSFPLTHSVPRTLALHPKNAELSPAKGLGTSFLLPQLFLPLTFLTPHPCLLIKSLLKRHLVREDILDHQSKLAPPSPYSAIAILSAHFILPFSFRHCLILSAYTGAIAG